MNRMQFRAFSLLEHLARVETWVQDNDPRAKAYIEAGAVRPIPGDPGHCEFHREKFIDTLMQEDIKLAAKIAGYEPETIT